MQEELDDILRRIVEDYATPEKRGELLSVLKLLRIKIIKDHKDEIVKLFKSVNIITDATSTEDLGNPELKEKYSL